MTPVVIWIITLAVAYLLGSIPTGYLLVRLFRKEDIRTSGSGNIGATNVARSGARGLGVATLVLDALKGFVAVVFAQHMAQWTGFPNGYALEGAAAIAVVVGHIFPVWLGFRGGKGVATALGVFLALMPLATVFAVLIFLLVFTFTRYVSLASIVAAALLAIFCVVADHRRDLLLDVAYIVIPLLVIAKHSGNISRLLARTEPQFVLSKKDRKDAA